MQHSTSQFLYTYWNEIRDGRIAPQRFEIEPARIGAILPDAFILERPDQGAFTFRLVGTRIGDRYGTELRRQRFDQNWSEKDRETIENALYDVSERGAVTILDVTVSDGGAQTANFEVLLLPLVHTKNRIDRILGTASLISDSPWVGLFPIASQTVKSCNLIWPEGHAAHSSDPGMEPPVLDSEVRKARIVTANRRQFRVYDGGLADALDDRLR